jgi:hypothetical protein
MAHLQFRKWKTLNGNILAFRLNCKKVGWAELLPVCSARIWVRKTFQNLVELETIRKIVENHIKQIQSVIVI